jgi:hypothetical protein
LAALWNHFGVFRSRLLSEYGGPCALRERARASGSQGLRERIRAAADQRMQRRGGGSVRSGLLFPCVLPPSVCSTWLFGRSNNRRDMELGSGGGQVAHGYEPRARVAIRNMRFLLELGSPSHECVLSLRYFDFHVVDAGSEHTYTNAGFTAARLLYSIPCGDAPVSR